ncbi:copper resistance protein B [Brevundimonas diminuta]|nr:copper resistance protein B [Brevundimonas diminuta ATCC 11568]OWR21835.1 copper resistance protein B [Brevundimonas diminuta]
MVPLILAATPALAQTHAGHGATSPAPRQAPPTTQGCVAPGSTTATTGNAGMSQSPASACPPGTVPARAAGAAHDMSTMGQAQPAPATAGHDMSTMPMGAAPAGQADPHAGHDMSTMGQAQPAPATAGHDMSTMPMGAAPAGQADPHAGHDMSTMGQAQPAPATAGHDMSTMPMGAPPSGQGDPHAGHDMSGMAGMAMPPDVPTGADNPGRPPQTPPPAGALYGPPHVADQIFSVEDMRAARRVLVAENGDIRVGAVMIDQLEATSVDGEQGYAWDAQGWYGGDIHRFWWKSEGEGEFGRELEEAELQALYSRAFTPYFDFQTGLRQTYRPEGDRTDLVVGVQGLAPYWFEVDAAAFLSNKGELTARAEVEYDQRITQRLILQPRAEVNLSAEDIPELGIGSGLSTLQVGARLRYEIRREFAPYVGVEWTRSFGDTRDFAEARGRSAEDTRVVVGVRAWF